MNHRVTINIEYGDKSEYGTRFFYTLSEAIDFLGWEYQKLPDTIEFSGKESSRIYEYVTNMNWDLAKFNPTNIDSTSNYNYVKITYSKSFKWTIESSQPMRDSDMNGRVVSGIPSSETMSKIIQYSSNISTTSEKWIKPEYTIIIKKK